jgi:hypothetical protein
MRRWRRQSAACILDWEPLADALKRVMAAGATEDHAKLDLSRAVADRKIRVRVRIAPRDRARSGQVFSGGNVSVPAHLAPSDFDWVQSRPSTSWPIGSRWGERREPEWIRGWENRPLDLIELSTADVTTVPCKVKPSNARRQGSRDKSRPAIERAQGVIKALYPNGMPDQATEPNAALCRRVSAKLKESKLPDVSDDTILRAAGRRK